MGMDKMPASFAKTMKKLASPAILFYALPWLMLLLTAGTLAQKDIGIFAAQAKYFSAWILWVGPIPLPGTYLTLGVITLGLLVKFIFYSPWRWERAGTVLTHLGILVLLIGGMLTAFTQKEGFMLIGEGQIENAISDYHDRVLRVERNGKTFAQIPFANLHKGVMDAELPFTATIESTCRNCRPVPVTDATGRQGLAETIRLQNAPLEKEEETNLSGATIAFSAAGKQGGTYVMMEEIPHKPSITAGEDTYEFSITRAETLLPFSIILKDFKRDMHPGTDMARGFSSDVVIRDGNLEWPYTIRMNEPLRYKGYTFYQASFSIRPDGEHSVLSVVQNKGRIFPYLASAIILLGLLMHVIIRLKNVRGIACLALLLLAANPASAADTLDYKSFAQIPVQHEGRVKPIDTFARSLLNHFHARETIDGMSADAWLAEILFDPAQALHRKTFRILQPHMLGLPVRERKYYSFAEIAPALQAKVPALQELLKIDEKDWSDDQREWVRIQESSVLYAQLLRSFSFLLPLKITPPESLIKEWKIKNDTPFTLQQYRRFEQKLDERVRKIIRSKGKDFSKYNQTEKQIAAFAFDMKTLQSAGDRNVLFRVIPGSWDGAKGEWYSPWALTQAGQGSPQSAEYVSLWQAMAKAYLEQNNSKWVSAAKDAADFSAAFIPEAKIGAELFYNNWRPFTIAMFAYLFAFLSFVFYGIRGNENFRLAAFGFVTLGAISHATAIALRVYILNRPPVGTLYESVLFVALVCVLAGVAYEYLKKDGNGIVIAAISGLGLLFVGESFAAEDSMQMLVAVLNTNFWLGTHVLCITIGYGWCLIVSLLAHLWLMREAWGKDASSLAVPIKTLALVALLFTTIGTILGGIWADQSWGRFWGWDPKENGALLIVLWLVWLFHAQISGHIKRLAFMAGMAALSIIVGLAWFGVNLLSTGLHSYGFISGVAQALGLFCLVDAALIGGLARKAQKRPQTA